MEIAICDDDELFNEIMSEKLSTVLNKNQIKYNITPFFNGSELITALNDPLNRFDVVFLDVDMPGVNGENVAQYINSSKTSIPVIFVTNHDDFVFSSFKYRPFGFLRKSHVDSELEEAVISLDNYLSKSGQCYTFTFQGKLISLPYNKIKYNVWRWDANSLVESILSSSLRTAGCRIHNCAAQNIIYERVDNIEIDAALQLLYSHKSEIEEQGANVIAVYNKLFSLLFTSLRIAVPFERKEIVRTQKTLEESKGALELEQRFMSQDLYNDLMGAVSNFEKVFTMTFQNPKVSRIAEIISSKKYSSICIVIADKLDKMRCEAYWRNYGVRKHSPTVVRVLYPQEYANSDTVRCDATIVVGWLNSKNMKNVIYCYGSSEYTILTYACEEKWRIAHTRS